MTGHPLRPATRQSLGRPSPHQQADRPRAHPPPEKTLSTHPHAKASEYPVLAPVSGRYPKEEGRLLTCYSPVRHSSNPTKARPSAFDLHVLSTPPAFVLSQDQTLRTKTKTLKPRKTNQPKQGRPAIPTKNTQKQKTGINKTNKHTIEFTNNTHTVKYTQIFCTFGEVFRAMFPRFQLSASFAAVRRNKENNTHFRAGRQIATPTLSQGAFSAGFRHFDGSFTPQKAKNCLISCCSTQNIKQNVPYAAKILPSTGGASCTHTQTITFFAQNFTSR